MSDGTVKKTRRRCLLLMLIILAISGGVPGFSQNSPPPASSEAISPSQVIQFLNQTIKWYRQLSAEQRITSEPDDQIVVYNNRQTADQVVRLSFDFARAQSEILARQGTSNPSQKSGGAPERYQALRAMEDKLNKTVKDTQAELDSNRQKLATATGRRRQEFASQVSELQAELELATARREAIQSMMEFVSGTSSSGLGATGLRAQVEALAASIPAASNPPTGRQPVTSSQGPVPAAGANATYSGQDISGIWDLTDDIFTQSSNIRTIDSLIAQTDTLSKAGKELRAPLTTRLKELFRNSDELAAQADTASPAQLDQEKKQLDGLAAQFKQIISASMPLSKQSVLLTLYLRSLTNWREAIEGRRKADWRNLGLRLGFLALILGIVFVSAELWRRAVYRYVPEPRQRYQFLLLRRFVLWLIIALIFAFTLAGRLTSIVTFAGLLTAGVAVALQSVILAVVGYFFLIGKFGIRVGDRVQIGSVTGEVIEIGLVRLHLMELGSGGFGAPTGRVVAFSNSIVFQPSSGLFKQISGTINWHEIRLMVPRTADLALVKERLLKPVTDVLANYSKELELQYREMKRTVQSVPADGLSPKIQLHILPANVEAVIRFPVSLRNESEMDERVLQALLKAVEGEPSLKSPGMESPAVHLRTDLSTADAAS